METKRNYIGFFAFAMVLVGEVIGVSFSTGREALTYFANFGIMSLFGMFLTYCLIFLYGYMSYVTARNMDKYTFDWIMTPFGWKPLRYFNLVFALVFLINALSAMFAGSGAILQSIFGLPYLIGAGLMLVASLITVSLSTEKFTKIFKYMVPIMVIMAIIVCIICAVDPTVPGQSWASASSSNPLLKTWWLSAFVYFGLQTGPLAQTVIPLSINVKDKKTAAISHVIGGFTIFAVAAVILVAIINNYSIASQGQVPILEIAFKKSSVLGLIYCAAAMMAIYSTTSAFLLIIKSSLETVKVLKEDKRKCIITLTVICVIGLALSTLGFATIVDKVYAVIGYASFIGIAGVTINYFYYKKHPVNSENTVD